MVAIVTAIELRQELVGGKLHLDQCSPHGTHDSRSHGAHVCLHGSVGQHLTLEYYINSSILWYYVVGIIFLMSVVGYG